MHNCIGPFKGQAVHSPASCLTDWAKASSLPLCENYATERILRIYFNLVIVTKLKITVLLSSEHQHLQIVVILYILLKIPRHSVPMCQMVKYIP